MKFLPHTSGLSHSSSPSSQSQLSRKKKIRPRSPFQDNNNFTSTALVRTIGLIRPSWQLCSVKDTINRSWVKFNKEHILMTSVIFQNDNANKNENNFKRKLLMQAESKYSTVQINRPEHWCIGGFRIAHTSCMSHYLSSVHCTHPSLYAGFTIGRIMAPFLQAARIHCGEDRRAMAELLAHSVTPTQQRRLTDKLLGRTIFIV